MQVVHLWCEATKKILRKVRQIVIKIHFFCAVFKRPLFDSRFSIRRLWRYSVKSLDGYISQHGPFHSIHKSTKIGKGKGKNGMYILKTLHLFEPFNFEKIISTVHQRKLRSKIKINCLTGEGFLIESVVTTFDQYICGLLFWKKEIFPWNCSVLSENEVNFKCSFIFFL